MWKSLCSDLRAKGDIVHLVASSGIASLLLPRRWTAHSRFDIPLNADEDSICSNLRSDHDVAGLIKRTKLIIRDEDPIMKIINITSGLLIHVLEMSCVDFTHPLEVWWLYLDETSDKYYSSFRWIKI